MGRRELGAVSARARHQSRAIAPPPLRGSVRAQGGLSGNWGLFQCALLLLLCLTSLCAEPQRGPTSQPAPEHVHNRVVHVPYGELDRILGRDGKGVLLKYDEYLELWRLGRKNRPEPLKPADSAPASLEKASYRGVVTGQTANFEATFEVRSSGDGPRPCAFGFHGVGLGSVTIDGKGASLFTDSECGLNLLTTGEERSTAKASFSTAVNVKGRRHSLRLRVPRATAGTMLVSLPKQAVIEEASVPITAIEDRASKETGVQLALGGHRDVAIVWNLAETRSVREPVLLAESRLQLVVRPGALRLDADVTVTVLRAKTSTLTFSLPPDQDLVAYEVPGLQRIETSIREGRKHLQLTLSAPHIGKTRVKLSTEAGWPGEGDLAFPRFELEGACRQSGTAGITIHQSLHARLKGVQHAERIEDGPDVSWFRQDGRMRPWRAFAFWRPGYRVAFAASPLPTETLAKVTSSLEIRERQCTLTSDIAYEVLKGERLSLRFEVPANWDVSSVKEYPHLLEAEWHEVAADDGRAVEVALPRKWDPSRGRYSCQLRCRRVPEEWLAESWKTRELPIPKVWVAEASTQDGTVRVVADPQFELTDHDLRGLEPVNSSEPVPDTGTSADARLAYSFRQPYGGALVVTRRSPRVSADIAQYVRVERDVYRVHAAVDYTVRYASTDEFLIALPGGLGREVAIQGEDLKEKALLSQGGEDDDTWRVRLHRARTGPYALLVSYEVNIPSGAESVAVGAVRALGVSRMVGTIGIEASSDVELHIKATKSLIEQDVAAMREHPAYRPTGRLIYAYRWLTHPVHLSLGLVRHEEGSVLPMLVAKASYRTVVDRSGRARTKATLSVRNASAPHLRVSLPARARLWSALVQGRPVKPIRSGLSLAVPLAAAGGPKEVLPVELTYEMPLGEMNGCGTLSFSGVKVENAPVLESAWELCLPEKYRYLSRSGNMTAATELKSGTQFVRVGGRRRWAFLPLLTSRRMRCVNNLRQLGSGMIQYFDQFGKGRYYSWPGGQTTQFDSAQWVASMYWTSLLNEGDLYVAPGSVDGEDVGEDLDRRSTSPWSTDASYAGRNGVLGAIIDKMPSNTLMMSDDSDDPPGHDDGVNLLHFDAHIEWSQAVASSDRSGRPGLGANRPIDMIRDDDDDPAADDDDGDDGAGEGPRNESGRRAGKDESSDTRAVRARPGTASPDHSKLLSMDIDIPEAGVSQSFKRLGGEPEIRITFVSRSFAQSLSTAILVAAFLVSVFLCRRNRVHVLLLLAVATILCVGLPLVAAEWLRPFCRSAMIGVLSYAGLRCLRFAARQIPSGECEPERDAPTRSCTVSSLLPLLLVMAVTSASPDATAEPVAQRPWKRGRTLYVPYDPHGPAPSGPLDKVYLPRQDFIELWQAAYPEAEPRGETRKTAPVPYAIGNASYVGRLEGDQGLFEASIDLETLADGWTEVPLRFSGIALREVQINGRPATMAATENGYSLGFPKPGRRTLALSFAVPVTRSSGQGQLSFRLPSVPASKLTFVAPAPGLELSASPCCGGQKLITRDGRSVLEADLGSVSQVTVSWSPGASSTARGLAAHLEAVNRQVVVVRQGYLEARSRMVLEVKGQPLAETALRVQRPLTVYSVSGNGLKDWAMDSADPEIVRISFAEPVLGEISLATDAGCALEAGEEEFAVPVITAVGASREAGDITLYSTPGQKLAVVSATGLRRGNAASCRAPGGVPSGAQVFATYAYSRTPYDLQVRIQPVEPQARSAVRSFYRIDATEISVQCEIEIEVIAGRLFETQLRLPGDWEVAGLSGANVAEWWLADPEDAQGVRVAFRGPVRGRTTLKLWANIRIDDPTRISVRAPAVVGAREERGSVGLAVRKGFALSTLSARNVRPQDFGEIWDGHDLPPGFAPSMAYSFRAADYELEVARARVQPHVIATAVTGATIETGLLRTTTALRYEVRDAVLDHLRFSLPGYVGNQIEMKSPGIRQVRSEVVEVDGEARRFWELKLDTPRTGIIEHQFDLELALAEDGGIRIPRIEMAGVRRARTYVVLANQSDYVVTDGEIVGLQEVPLTEVPFFPKGYARTSAATGYKARGADWSLAFSKEMTQLEAIVEAAIDWAEVKTQVREDGNLLSKAVYHLQNRTEQYLEVAMPGGAEIWSIFVRGEPVRPARRAGSENLLVPLIKTTGGDLSFDVEVVYSHRLGAPYGRIGTHEIAGPRVLGVPVTHTHWTLRLPQGFRHFGFRGNVDEVVEEVGLVDKLKAMVRDQERLLLALKHGTVQEKIRATKNWGKLRTSLQKGLTEAKERNAQKRAALQRGELGRYQRGTFATQLDDNDAGLMWVETEDPANHDEGVNLLYFDTHVKWKQPVGQKGSPSHKDVPRRTAEEGSRERSVSRAEAEEAAGVSCIRVEFPEEGVPFHFRKLQGGAKIRFHYVSRESTERSAKWAGLVAVLVVVFGVRRVARKRRACADV